MSCEISFVIPCYNSEKTIGKVIEEIKSSAKEKNYEIICVNDGSKDNVYRVLCDYAEKDKKEYQSRKKPLPTVQEVLELKKG